MFRSGLCVAVMALSCFSASAPVCAGEPGESINGRPAVAKVWDAYKLKYPAGRWELTEDQADESRARFQLKPKGGNDIILEIMMMKDMPTEDPHYENNPQMYNTSLLLSAALELAKKDESKIYFSAGVSNTQAGWYTCSRAMVLMEDHQAINLEACHESDLPNGRIMSAILMTKSKAGQVPEDPAYNEKLVEAYEIIQAIEYSVPEAGEGDSEE